MPRKFSDRNVYYRKLLEQNRLVTVISKKKPLTIKNGRNKQLMPQGKTGSLFH